MRGHTAGWSFTSLGETQNHKLENAYSINQLKTKLVLRYLPSDIEDTFYFMEHRGYLLIHGQGMINPKIAYTMTEKAITVFDQQKLPEDEREAFKESLWNIEPKFYGVGPNLSAWKELIKRWRKK